MSLEDKFFPEDGSLLTRFDNSMIKTAGIIGEIYQHLTGRSYQDLVSPCYGIASAGLCLSSYKLFSASGAVSLPLSIAAIGMGLLSLHNAYHPKYESPLEEEIRQEAHGINKKYGKIMRASVLFMTPALINLGQVLIGAHVSRNTRWLREVGIGGFMVGVSMIPHCFADYLSKANIPKPPAKTVWKRAGDYLRNLVPELKPATVGNRHLYAPYF
jgi:hypothetical protein